MMLHVVPFYAALLTILYIFLSIRTIRFRRKLKISIGDGEKPEMVRVMRVHSNFAEYTPIALILFSMLELNNAQPGVIHGLCSLFLLARMIHAYGVSQSVENFKLRITGMASTFTAMGISALYLLIQLFS